MPTYFYEIDTGDYRVLIHQNGMDIEFSEPTYKGKRTADFKITKFSDAELQAAGDEVQLVSHEAPHHRRGNGSLQRHPRG